MLALFKHSGLCLGITTESLTPCTVELPLFLSETSQNPGIPTEVLHKRPTGVPCSAIKDSHYLMNQGTFTSLKVFLATSLIVSHRILYQFSEDSFEMNFVQELSGETHAFSRLTSPSSRTLCDYLASPESPP